MAQLPLPQILHDLLSVILTISERKERCKGVRIGGNKYCGMGLAGALTVAQFVASIYYTNCRALYHCSSYPTLIRFVLIKDLDALRSGKKGCGGWADLLSVGPS